MFFATTESNRIAGRRVMLADHDPGAGGSWMGGRGQTWREGQHGGQPILCKPTPICRPALYASSVHGTGPPALFRRCQIFFLNADCSQTVSRASKVGTYVTEIVKCRPNPATGRKYQTKQTKNKQGSTIIGRPYAFAIKLLSYQLFAMTLSVTTRRW